MVRGAHDEKPVEVVLVDPATVILVHLTTSNNHLVAQNRDLGAVAGDESGKCTDLVDQKGEAVQWVLTIQGSQGQPRNKRIRASLNRLALRMPQNILNKS